MHRLLRIKSSYISLTYAIPSENFIVSFSQWKFDFSDFIMLCSTFYIRRGWVGRLSENNITCAWNQWNKLPRKTNSKLSSHMTEAMWVQCFQVPKIFCVLASPNLAFIFLIGPFLLHIFCTFCSKNAKIRRKRQTTSQKMYFPATHEGFCPKYQSMAMHGKRLRFRRVESQMYSKRTQLTNRAKLETVISHTKSGTIEVNKIKNKIKKISYFMCLKQFNMVK